MTRLSLRRHAQGQTRPAKLSCQLHAANSTARERGRLWTVIALLLAIGSIGTAAADASKRVLTLGIVPQQSASQLAKLWTPVAELLSKATGYELRFATAPNIPTFEKRLAAGEYDFAYMNPYHYVVMNKTSGYRAFAKEEGRLLQGIIVVRTNSSYHSLGDLQGQIVAFPSPNAFAASLLPRAELEKERIPFETSYAASHDSVYRGIVAGLYAAGGGVERTFQNLDPVLKNQLRILWTTPPHTPHAFAVHPRIGDDVVAAIRDAMIAIKSTEEGRTSLTALGFNGFIGAQDSDWDDVRALDIQVPNAVPEQ